MHGEFSHLVVPQTSNKSGTAGYSHPRAQSGCAWHRPPASHGTATSGPCHARNACPSPGSREDSFARLLQPAARHRGAPTEPETCPGDVSPAPGCRRRRLTEKRRCRVPSTFWPLERTADLLAPIQVLTARFSAGFDSAQGDGESASAHFVYSLCFNGDFF